MPKATLTINVQLDDNLCNWFDEEERDWCIEHVFGTLLLHSNEIGDTIGEIETVSGLIHSMGLLAVEFDHKGITDGT